MGAGKYRHYITIQQPVETIDDVGQTVTSWEDYKTVWAQIQPLKGREYWQSQQVNAEVTHRITIRYLEGINSKMRVKFGDRYFEIEPPINPDEKNVELVMLCKEDV